MSILLHGLAPPDRQTNRTCQPGAQSIFPPIRQWTTGWLVWPPTYRRVLVQQSCPLHHLTNSVPARHWKTSSHKLQTLTEPFQSRDSQWIHGKDKDGNWRSEVCDPQSTGWHEKILWPTKNSSSSVQTQWQSLPWHIRYPDYVPFAETLTLTA